MDRLTKVLLVGVNINNDPDFERNLAELEALAEACAMEVVGVERQNLPQANTGVYVGTGKVDEIKALAHMLDAEMVIFDNSLSPVQLRNLNEIIELPVMDRTNLILMIFSSRARTREAQIQVETARLQYELPRLTGMGLVLSRQGG
ncbi:MAG: GTPase HflX, partial [Eubacterium sp.]|nr:GTPase HflX [Eubacterium sp.]